MKTGAGTFGEAYAPLVVFSGSEMTPAFSIAHTRGTKVIFAAAFLTAHIQLLSKPCQWCPQVPPAPDPYQLAL